MAQTMIQKIIANNVGQSSVKEGEIVFVKPYRVLTHDNSSAISKIFESIAGDRLVWDNEKIFIALDHNVPAPDEKQAANHQIIRKFVKKHNIKHFYEGGTGICHQVLPEYGHVLPGSIILGSDSHTTTHGAFGAAGIPIGRTEAASIWAIGETWLKVPETIKITISGTPKSNVFSKDIILNVIKKITADGATYKAIEFHGSVVENFSISDRMTICNLSAEMGAKAAMVPPDKITHQWLSKITSEKGINIFPDKDAIYEKEFSFDVSDLTPQIAKPHKVDNVSPVSEMKGYDIDVAFLGTCTNGRIEDLREAAKILKGNKIHRNVRLLVYPASQKVLEQAMREGIMADIVAAGGQVAVPACGPCLGAYGGILAPGEKAISTANRNFKGRMGCKTETEIYLASPATVAKSALAGKIEEVE